MSEELENSLQQAIESYLNERLRATDEQISRLQTEFNEALARLREGSAASLEATPISATIAAHLQAAREQKLSGKAIPEGEASEVAIIKRAVAEIEKQTSQSSILSALLMSAAQFAERVALFVIKNEQAIGWRVCEASDTSRLEAMPSIALPLTADTIVCNAAQSRSTVSGPPGSNSQDGLLIDRLGGEPQSMAAVPLVVREKAVAVLYADSTSPEPGTVNVDAIETLVRVAEMAVVVVSTARVAQPARVAEPRIAPPPAAPEPEREAPIPVQPVAQEAAFEPTYVPQIEPQMPEVSAEPVVEEEAAAPPAEIPIAEAAAPTPEPVPEPAVIESELPPPPISPPSAPRFAPQYAAPLGTARRYGVAEPELPIEVGEEERRLHNDARRFARLLVSEIKLYNEQKVKDGRSQSNIYDHLRDDIDRSRQMYDKRVAPPVAARYDYFHQELVNTLAEGDPSKLGANYPGAMVSA